jgi:hypothetical protein
VEFEETCNGHARRARSVTLHTLHFHFFCRWSCLTNLLEAKAPPIVVFSSRLKADLKNHDARPGLRASGPSTVNELQAWPAQTDGDLVFVKCRRTCDMDSQGFVVSTVQVDILASSRAVSSAQNRLRMKLYDFIDNKIHVCIVLSV